MVATRSVDIRGMRRAGRSAAHTLDAACALVRPGVTTLALDRFVAADTRRRRGRCAQHGYRVGPRVFPGHLCTSVNEVVCHGVPREEVVLQQGDLVNLDVTTQLRGYHGDTSRTVLVGRPTPEAAHVTQVAQRALQLGIEAVRPHGPLHAIGHAIEAFVRSQGCSVVTDYGGHGIGRRMHEAPHVPHHAAPGDGPRLVPGLCFTIEPMVCLGTASLRHDPDGWTVRTADGRLSAQFEHTLRVTDDGVEVLTAAP